MKTIYLSGPMTGIPEKNRPLFTKWANTLRALGYNVISPPEMDQDPDTGYDDNYYKLLKHAIQQMLTADFVITLPGWKSSKGASLEVDLANKVQIPVYDIKDLAQFLNGGELL